MSNKDFEFEEGVAEKEAVDPRLGLPPEVNIETASAPMELVVADGNNEGPWIEYFGVGTVRVMDAAAWKEAHVDSTQYVEWNYMNENRVPRSLFNDHELQYLLRVDGRFRLVHN